PGERSMTKAEWKAQESRRRAQESLQELRDRGELDGRLENPSPGASTQGHSHDWHGNQTTAAQQQERVLTGRTPTGVTPLKPNGQPKIPGTASRYGSPEAELEAYMRAKRELDAQLKSGSVPSFTDPATGQPTFVNPATGAPVRRPVPVTTNRPGGFGEGFRKQVNPGAPPTAVPVPGPINTAQ